MDSREEAQNPISVQLTPALLLDCRLNWKKFLVFILFVNLPGLFLHYFGFGPSYAYSLIFCNCAAWSGFAFLIPASRILKPERVIAMVVRIFLVFVGGGILGAVAFAVITGRQPASVFGVDSDILIRMILIELFFGPMDVFFFMTREHISETKRIILEEKIRNLDMKNLATEAELKLLQAQIEPHFLFNTLSNALSLIDADPAKAKIVMERFSDFLRGCIHIARERDVPVSQELELVRSYLDIHRLRMGHRLSYDISVPDYLLGCRIPPLLIQPLVENSIKHGLEPKVEGGIIAIQGELEGGTFRISVIDSGRGIQESSGGNGVGLENIRKRIEMLCNDNGRLILEENRPSGIRAIIEVPHERG